MNYYHWKAINLSGRRLEGHEYAYSSKELCDVLHQKKITLLRYRKMYPIEYQISEQQLCQLTQQLALLLNSALPMLSCVELLMEQASKPAYRSVLCRIKDELKQGHNLSHALALFPQYFAPYYCALVECGEKSSQLTPVLTQLAQYQALRLMFKKKLRRALSYPLCVLSLSLAISAGIILWVIPQFAHLFKESGHSLPGLTQALFTITGVLEQQGAWILLFSALALFAVYRIYPRSQKIRSGVAALSLKIPLLKHSIQLIQIARWSRLLATHLQAGTPLFEALKAAEQSFTHPSYQTAYRHSLASIHSGTSLIQALRENPFFPKALSRLLALGEHSGTLRPLLEQSARLYEQQLEDFLMTLSQWAEPITLLLIASLSAMLIIALYLPLFRMGTLF